MVRVVSSVEVPDGTFMIYSAPELRDIQMKAESALEIKVTAFYEIPKVIVVVGVKHVETLGQDGGDSGSAEICRL